MLRSARTSRVNSCATVRCGGSHDGSRAGPRVADSWTGTQRRSSRDGLSDAAEQAHSGIPVTDEPITAKGKRVVIIGGGDTGSDCLGTTHRQGCVEVHQFELLPEPPLKRADSTPWPLWPMQLRTSHAHEEGCDRQWSVSTTKFTGHNGHVTKLHGQSGEIRERQVCADCSNTDFEMDVDLVLLAMGFTGPVKTACWTVSV